MATALIIELDGDITSNTDLVTLGIDTLAPKFELYTFAACVVKSVSKSLFKAVFKQTESGRYMHPRGSNGE